MSTRSPTEFDQNNRDVTSIPGYVIKKNSCRGAKHGPSERQRMYFQAKQMLKKVRQKKHGRHPTTLSRWYAGESYRKSLYVIGRRQKHLMLYDRIALEKHIYIATRAETIQNLKHWILTINAEGPEQPLSQRPEHLVRTQEEYRTILRSQQVRQRKGQQFEGNEEYDYAVDPKTGWRFYKGSRGNLPTASSGSRSNLQTALSSSSTWDQVQWTTSNWNSRHSTTPYDW